MTDEKEGFVPVETIRSEKTIKSNNPLKNIDLSQVKVSELPIPNPEKLFRSHNDRTQKDSSKYESLSLVVEYQGAVMKPST